MTYKNLLTIYRFLGVIEGIAETLPEKTQTLVYDYIEAIEFILSEEEKRIDNA